MRALVTGASRGIGRAVALALSARGAQLALCAREPQSLEALCKQLSCAHALSCDLSRAEQAEALVGRAVAVLGGLDVVINCAGIVHYAAVGGVTRESLAEQLAVNLVAPFLIAQRAAEHMRADSRAGVIINVASTLGLRPAPDSSAYAASKAGMIAMTRAFALELGPSNIRVNAVAPGIIDTDMIRIPRATEIEALRKLHPLGRLGTAEEVAEAVLYLIDADFVTGTVLTIDGGLLVAS